MPEIGSEISLETRVEELLPSRDDLRGLVADVTPREKNAFLEAIDQPGQELFPVIALNGNLQAMANALGQLAAIKLGYDQTRPNLYAAELLQLPNLQQLMRYGNRVYDFEDLFSSLGIRGVDHNEIFRRMDKELTHLAHQAAGESDSYRRYQVGCVGYYIDEEHEKVGIFATANSKPHDLAPKYCAERKNLDRAEESGMTRCIGLVNFGTPQLDQDSDKTPNTAHPCFACREEIWTNPIVPDDAIVICTDDRTLKQEEYTPTELMKFHGELST